MSATPDPARRINSGPLAPRSVMLTAFAVILLPLSAGTVSFQNGSSTFVQFGEFTGEPMTESSVSGRS